MGLVFIAAVAALSWLAFRDAPWFRQLFGLQRFTRHETLLNGAADANEALAGIVARAGGRAEPTWTIDRSAHRTTWGVRLLSLAVAGAIVWFVLNPPAPPGGMKAVGDIVPGGLYGAVFFLALAVYSVILTWAYRLEIDRDTLSVMGPVFIMRDYPLSGLEQIEEDGPYAWRMRFADGRRPHVIKTVVGGAELRHRLADVLDANQRG